MILIVESDLAVRGEIIRTVRWIDGRHRIETADNLWDGARLAGVLRPHFVLLGPGIEKTGGDFVPRLRQTLPGASMIVIYNGIAPEHPELFDAALKFPINHVELDKIIASRRAARAIRTDKTSAAFARHKRRAPLARPEQLHVTVRLADADADGLQFKIQTQAGASVGKVLQLLGKHSVEWYRLYRNTDELNVNLETPLHDGDELLLGSPLGQIRGAGVS